MLVPQAGVEFLRAKEIEGPPPDSAHASEVAGKKPEEGLVLAAEGVGLRQEVVDKDASDSVNLVQRF